MKAPIRLPRPPRFTQLVAPTGDLDVVTLETGIELDVDRVVRVAFRDAPGRLVIDSPDPTPVAEDAN